MSTIRINESIMANYRLYCLERGGQISFAEWLDADDDEEAVRQAQDLKRTALKCEVWSGTRLVATLEATDLA